MQGHRARPATLATVALLLSGPAWPHCAPGLYGADAQQRVVLVAPPGAATPAQRYVFLDGRRGRLDEPSSPVRCTAEGQVHVQGDAQAQAQAQAPTQAPAAVAWPRLPLTETDTHFDSAATRLVGRLIEPEAPPTAPRSLVVLVHGSERTAAIGTSTAYLLAAQGLSVFVYDKRGTGASGGEYGQNFELLADDATAAMRHARTLAAGRHARSGFFGASQGGWVAPMAAQRAGADFVAVAYGLVASPIDEDREQMLQEARRAGLDARAQRSIRQLSAATARLVRSHFTRGFAELQALRQALRGQAWTSWIQGEYSGDMLRMSDSDLRRIGRARFDNLELPWDHDALAVLKRLRTPLLWVLAAEDREAPPEGTRQALTGLKTAQGTVTVFEFPDTDHGILEFTTDATGRRQASRFAEGYFRLLGDWMSGGIDGPGANAAATTAYGRARRIR